MNLAYQDTVNFLGSFINYERAKKFPYKKSLKLERVKRLHQKLKIDTDKLCAIHIAGTKGKGSTATFLSFVLAKAGYKVGLYTSPHFDDLRERIKIVTDHSSGIKLDLIPKYDVVSLMAQMKPTLKKLRFDKKLGSLSFFEIYTSLAFKYFLKQKVDFAVLECGLGGRLDATNVIRPLVSIITHIGQDHTQLLGNTISSIAFEKAGIIKRDVPAITSHQRKNVLEVLVRKARQSCSKIYIYKNDFVSNNIRYNSDSTLFDFNSEIGSFKDLLITLRGRSQVENASLATQAFMLLKDKYALGYESLYRGLRESFIEARFQVIARRKHLFILDIAHNVDSFKVLQRDLEEYFPQKKVILIFGCSCDKNYKKMLQNVKYNKLVLTQAENARALNPRIIKKNCQLKKSSIEMSPRNALRLAKNIYKNNSIIVIAGSFFLVAQMRKYLKLYGEKS